MGKYKADYTITVLSASLYQYNNSTQAPLTLGPFGPINLRQKCAPYLAGSFTAIDRGMREICFPLDKALSASLLAPGGGTYSPTFIWDQTSNATRITPGSQIFPFTIGFINDVPLIMPGAQSYGISLDAELIGLMPLISPAGQTYDPSWSALYNESVPLITPAAQTYDPSWTTLYSFSNPLITPGAQTYNPTICPYTYTVGTGGEFATIQDALTPLYGTTLACAVEIQISGGLCYAEQIIVRDIVTSATKTLTFMPWPGTTADQIPCIDGGQVSGEGQCPLWIMNVGNVIVDNIKFTGWSYTGTGYTLLTEPPGFAAIYIGRSAPDKTTNQATNITIQNCTMSAEQGGRYCIYSASGSSDYNTDITIVNCLLTGTRGFTNSGTYGIYEAGGGYLSVVSASAIREMSVEGIGIYGNNVNPGQGMMVRQTEISNCELNGIIVDKQPACYFKNNLIFNCGQSADGYTIYFTGSMNSTKFYYNTVVSTGSGGNLITFYSCSFGENTNFKDNIYRFRSETLNNTIYFFTSDPGSKFYSDYNVFSLSQWSGGVSNSWPYAPFTVWDYIAQVDTTYYARLTVGSPTYDAWTGSGDDLNSVAYASVADPALFVNGPYDNFLLAAGSLAEGAAIDVGIYVDKLGKIRPYDSLFDIGCFEQYEP